MLAETAGMHPAPVSAHVQKVRVARIGGRQVALLQVRVPGETLHVVVADGLGVGLVDGAQRTALRDALAGASRPDSSRAEAIAREAADALAGTPPDVLRERGARIVDRVGREGRKPGVRRY